MNIRTERKGGRVQSHESVQNMLLCSYGTKPLTLLEARQMTIDDVVFVSTMREDVRNRTLQIDAAEIPLCVGAEQLDALGLEIAIHLRFPKSEACSPVCLRRDTKEATAHKTHESGDELERLVNSSCSPFTESLWTMELTKV